MSTSTNDQASVSDESKPQANDGVLRTRDLSELGPVDTPTFDNSVATGHGAKPHPFRNQAVAIVLLAAMSSARREYHYRHSEHPPCSDKPWRWVELEFDHHGIVATFSYTSLTRRVRAENAIRRPHENPY